MWSTVDAACEAIVRVQTRVPPQPQDAKTMQKNYAAYRRVYPATKAIFS
jgi:sugar (pentulose or hexulose) kinase